MRSAGGSWRVNTGTKVVLTYVAVYLLAPALTQYLYSRELSSIYQVTRPDAWTLLSAVTLGLFTACISLSRFSPIPTLVEAHLSRGAKAFLAAYDRVRPVFAACLLLFATRFYASGLNAYRYTQEGMSTLDTSLVMAATAMTTVCTADVFRRIFVERSVEPLRSPGRIADLAIATSLLLTANGTAGALVSFTALSFAIAPATFMRTFQAKVTTPLLARAAVATLALAVVGAIAFTAWIGGEAIKGSSRGDTELAEAFDAVRDRVETVLTPQSYLYYLGEALSSHYHSTLFTLGTSFEQRSPEGAFPLALPLRSFAFRLDLLLGHPFGAERPDPGSMSRWNYVLLTGLPLNERAGTSPGVVASFQYAFGWPLGLLASAAYFVWLARFIDRIVPPVAGRVWTLPAVGIILLWLLGLFESPLDYLIVVDNSTLFVCLLGVLCLANAPNRKPRQRAPDRSRPMSSARVGDPASGSGARPRVA